MKRNKRVLFFLLFPAFVMLAITVLPHHHHDNGFFCMHTESDANPADDDDHHTVPCLDGCIARLHQAENTPEYAFSWIHFLLISPLTGRTVETIAVPAAESRNVHGNRKHAERLHGTDFSSCSGLRAPPSLIG
ncbi:MAG: hypothetical protein J1E02_00045 [Coprobacter sp.]|nr:hypothetical protein [Coprobacter sp.]